MKKTRKLRELIEGEEIIVAPGATDCFVAKIIEEAGFPVVYATGAGISNTMLGFPDLGLTTMGEIVTQAGNIASAVKVPIIADADDGYGNPLNVMRTVREFERAGVAGIHIEDQVAPKRCGHFEGKEVIRKEEMVQKIRTAVDARDDEAFVIIARTDARDVEGLSAAIKRGRAYLKAGADAIFVEAPRSVEELRLISKSIQAPLVANMVEGGKTPLLSAVELKEMGYKLVIFANLALRVGAKAIKDAMDVLKKEGTSKKLLDRMISFSERQRIVGLPEFQELEKKYLSLPQYRSP